MQAVSSNVFSLSAGLPAESTRIPGFSLLDEENTPFPLASHDKLLPQDNGLGLRRPQWGGVASMAAFISMAAVGFVLGKRGLGKYLQRGLKNSKNPVAKLAPLPEKAAEDAKNIADEGAQKFQLFRNIESPLLTMAFLSQQPAFRGVLGWFGAASVAGFLGGNVLQGFQETWIRAEETAIRRRALDSMIDTYRESVRNRNQFLLALKHQTWQTVGPWLASSGLDIDALNPLLAGTLPMGETNTDHFGLRNSQFHQNYLLEPRNRSQSPYFTGDSFLPEPESPSLTPLSAKRWWPWFSGAAGLAVGAVMSGINTTARHFGQLVGRTQYQTPNKEMITGLFVKNTEALAVLARQIEAPALLLAYGVAVGIVTAGKKWIEGLREIAVTEENTLTELSYQRYQWKQLGSQLMAVAETEWLRTQLVQLAQDLPALKTRPEALKSRLNSLFGGIGFNSAPPHYNTPMELNITEARG